MYSSWNLFYTTNIKSKLIQLTFSWKSVYRWCTLILFFILPIFCRLMKHLPSRQILVPRTSPSNVPRTSPKDPIWPFRGRPGEFLKWRPGVVLIRRSRDIPGRLIRDVPRTFSGRPLEDIESTQTWMSNFF